jgi:hypothetical protein
MKTPRGASGDNRAVTGGAPRPGIAHPRAIHRQALVFHQACCLHPMLVLSQVFNQVLIGAQSARFTTEIQKSALQQPGTKIVELPS